ncbi:MAG: ester cyclase [Rubrobacteraceae bacterium]
MITSRHSPTWIDEHIAPDFVRHDPGLPFETPGPEGVRHLNTVLLTAFPDLRPDIGDVIAEEGKVLARLTIRATVEVGVLDLFRIAGGKIAEHWAMIDNLGMMRQPGVIST